MKLQYWVMLLAALAPALVIRSSLASIDMWATLGVTAAFLFAHRAAATPGGRGNAGGAPDPGQGPVALRR